MADKRFFFSFFLGIWAGIHEAGIRKKERDEARANQSVGECFIGVREGA